jgi:CHAD domain-containing protein
MSFELRADEGLRSGIHRVAKSEMEKVREYVDGSSKGSRDVKVHEARKSLKRLRAVLRLVRPAIARKVYRRENMAFRDAARPLSEVRDAKILLETLDKIVKTNGRGRRVRPFMEVRRELARHQRGVSEKVLDQDDAFTTVDSTMKEALDRLDDWVDVHGGWSSVVKGVQRVYRRGRRAYGVGSEKPTVEHLHEWRKQVKYLRHQLELLRPVKASVLEPLAKKAEDLGDILGDDHDLAMLRREVAGDPERFGGTEVVESLLDRIDRRRERLERRALSLGRQIFRRAPKDFGERLHAYWKARS